MIEYTTMEINKAVREQKPISKIGYDKPYFFKNKQPLLQTNCTNVMIKNNVTLKTYQMFNQLNCKINYMIFLLNCLKFQKQYDGKSEAEFNIRLNNHRKNVTRKDSIPASNHFDIGGRNFNMNPKFMLTE